MNFVPNEKVNFKKAKSEYEALINWKNATGIEGDVITQENIKNFCAEHNRYEIYTLTYMIESILTLPYEVQKQYEALSFYLDDNEKYQKLLNDTQILYKNNSAFIEHYNELYDELELNTTYNKNFFNQMIYEFCPKNAGGKIVPNEQNAIINLHFVQKWLNEHDYSLITTLEIDEVSLLQKIIQNGYFENDNNITAEFLKIEEKLNVNSIFQAIALYYYGTHRISIKTDD